MISCMKGCVGLIRCYRRDEWEKDEDEENEADPEYTPDGAESVDDWRKFFDEDASAQNAVLDQKTPSARLHKLTVHQSLHSLSSHRAIFTRAWLALLPLLSTGSADSAKGLVARALNVMHRGVMPHLTRAVMVMDWLASCVDYGMSSCMYPSSFIVLRWLQAGPSVFWR